MVHRCDNVQASWEALVFRELTEVPVVFFMIQARIQERINICICIFSLFSPQHREL